MGVAEQGFLPEGEQSLIASLIINPKYIYDSISLTGQSLLLTDNKQASFVSALNLQMEGLQYSLQKTMSRIAWQDGRGVMANVNGGAAIGATTLTIDNAGGDVHASGGGRFLTVGMKLGVVDPTDTTLVTTVQISAINATMTTITLSSALTVAVADNSILYMVNNVGTSATFSQSLNRNNEPVGLRNIINDATTQPTYFGLSRVTFPTLSSPVIDVAGALSDDVVQQAFDFVQANSISEDQSGIAVLCGQDTRRAYLAVTVNIRRIATDSRWANPDLATSATKGMENNVTIGNIPILVSTYAPFSQMVFVDKSQMKKIENNVGWMTETGAMWKQISGAGGRQDAYVADFRKFCAYFNTSPRTSVRLKNITTSIVIHETI
jgi:hypothetical protein